MLKPFGRTNWFRVTGIPDFKETITSLGLSVIERSFEKRAFIAIGTQRDTPHWPPPPEALRKVNIDLPVFTVVRDHLIDGYTAAFSTLDFRERYIEVVEVSNGKISKIR